MFETRVEVCEATMHNDGMDKSKMREKWATQQVLH
jgi:hypothetical protein